MDTICKLTEIGIEQVMFSGGRKKGREREKECVSYLERYF